MTEDASAKIHRRAWLLGGSAAAAGLASIPWMRRLNSARAPVFIARGQNYDVCKLTATIRDGLRACGIDAARLRGKHVLLKPNLVEPSRSTPHLTTHPAMLLAAAEVFLFWGASVVVGEGPGHERDTEKALIESGFDDALQAGRLAFADLNYEPVHEAINRGGASNLRSIFLPRSVVEADLIVSLPKLKTHHWAGVTCSMKNLYGLLPGIQYGWPKNVLHHFGIPQTVVDINATVQKTIAIVDAIDCMEGDGPIMGGLKRMGLVLVGGNLPAVDATAARIMHLRPDRIEYLRLAAGKLGPIDEHSIEQRGERWQSVASRFAILDVPHLRRLRDQGAPAT